MSILLLFFTSGLRSRFFRIQFLLFVYVSLQIYTLRALQQLLLSLPPLGPRFPRAIFPFLSPGCRVPLKKAFTLPTPFLFAPSLHHAHRRYVEIFPSSLSSAPSPSPSPSPYMFSPSPPTRYHFVAAPTLDTVDPLPFKLHVRDPATDQWLPASSQVAEELASVLSREPPAGTSGNTVEAWSGSPAVQPRDPFLGLYPPSLPGRSSKAKRGGPCDHCHTTQSPLWRRGPSCKPCLCNACGTRWKKKGTPAFNREYAPKSVTPTTGTTTTTTTMVALGYTDEVGGRSNHKGKQAGRSFRLSVAQTSQLKRRGEGSQSRCCRVDDPHEDPRVVDNHSDYAEPTFSRRLLDKDVNDLSYADLLFDTQPNSPSGTTAGALEVDGELLLL